MRCRICHNGGTRHSPLLRPCACRGSIAHAHESCMLRWLLQRRSLRCEVCHASFSCTKVYTAGTAPGVWRHAGASVRLRLLAMLVLLQTKKFSALLLRLLFFASVWLLIVPLLVARIFGVASDEQEPPGNVTWIGPQPEGPAAMRRISPTTESSDSILRGMIVAVFEFVSSVATQPWTADPARVLHGWAAGTGYTVLTLVSFYIVFVWLEWCSDHVHLFPEVVADEIAAADALHLDAEVEDLGHPGDDGAHAGGALAEDEGARGHEDGSDDDATDDTDDGELLPNSHPTRSNSGTPSRAASTPVDAAVVPSLAHATRDGPRHGEVARHIGSGGEPSLSDEASRAAPPQEQSSGALSSPPHAPPGGATTVEMAVDEADAERVFAIIRGKFSGSEAGRLRRRTGGEAQLPAADDGPGDGEDGARREITLMEMFGFSGSIVSALTFPLCFLAFSLTIAMIVLWLPASLGFVIRVVAASWAASATEWVLYLASLAAASWEWAPQVADVREVIEGAARLWALLAATLAGVSPHAVHINVLGGDDLRDFNGLVPFSQPWTPSRIPGLLQWLLGAAVGYFTLYATRATFPPLMRKLTVFYCALARVAVTQLCSMMLLPVLTALLLPLVLNGYSATTRSLHAGLHPQWHVPPFSRALNRTLTPLEAAFARLPPLDIGLCALDMKSVSRNLTAAADPAYYAASTPGPFELFHALYLIWERGDNSTEVAEMDPFYRWRVDTFFNTSRCSELRSEHPDSPAAAWAASFSSGRMAFWHFAVGCVASHLHVFTLSPLLLTCWIAGFALHVLVHHNINVIRDYLHINILRPLYIERPEAAGLEVIVRISWCRIVFVLLRNMALVVMFLLLIIRPALARVTAAFPEMIPVVMGPDPGGLSPAAIMVVLVTCNVVRLLAAPDVDNAMSLLSAVARASRAVHRFAFKYVGVELDLDTYFRTGIAPRALSDLSFPLRLFLFIVLYWIMLVAGVTLLFVACGLPNLLLQGVGETAEVHHAILRVNSTAASANFVPALATSGHRHAITLLTAAITVDIAVLSYALFLFVLRPLATRIRQFRHSYRTPAFWLRASKVELALGLQLSCFALSITAGGRKISHRSVRVSVARDASEVTQDRMRVVRTQLAQRLAGEAGLVDAEAHRRTWALAADLIDKALDAHSNTSPAAGALVAMTAPPVVDALHECCVDCGLAARHALVSIASALLVLLPLAFGFVPLLVGLPVSNLFLRVNLDSPLLTVVRHGELRVIVAWAVGCCILAVDGLFARVLLPPPALVYCSQPLRHHMLTATPLTPLRRLLAPLLRSRAMVLHAVMWNALVWIDVAKVLDDGAAVLDAGLAWGLQARALRATAVFALGTTALVFAVRHSRARERIDASNGRPPSARTHPADNESSPRSRRDAPHTRPPSLHQPLDALDSSGATSKDAADAAAAAGTVRDDDDDDDSQTEGTNALAAAERTDASPTTRWSLPLPHRSSSAACRWALTSGAAVLDGWVSAAVDRAVDEVHLIDVRMHNYRQ